MLFETMKFTVLDVTLRDGGNRNHFHFSDQDILQILPALDQSGVDCIEIGYRNGAIRPVPGLGSAGLCDEAYLHTCRALIQRAKMVVMAHPHNLTRQDLEALKAHGVDLLRLCILKDRLQEAYPILEEAKTIGLAVSLNFIHASFYSEQELNAVVAQASLAAPNLIYFADSNGSLLPERVAAIYQQYTAQYPEISFGFHAHDNLGLAQMNTIMALQAGARYVDASLAGMGKGIGNLKTEFFVAYLHGIKMNHYQLERIVSAANYVRGALKSEQEPIELDEFIRGIHDYSTADIMRLKKSTTDKVLS